MPAETDPWVQATFRRRDGTFDAAAYIRWRQHEEQRIVGPIVITPRDVWLSAWLQRLVQESNMFYGSMVPMLPSYYRSYDEVPWEDAYLWGVIAEINSREAEKSHGRYRRARGGTPARPPVEPEADS